MADDFDKKTEPARDYYPGKRFGGPDNQLFIQNGEQFAIRIGAFQKAKTFDDIPAGKKVRVDVNIAFEIVDA